MAISAPVWGGKVSRGRDFAMRTASISAKPASTRVAGEGGGFGSASAGDRDLCRAVDANADVGSAVLRRSDIPRQRIGSAGRSKESVPSRPVVPLDKSFNRAALPRSSRARRLERLESSHTVRPNKSGSAKRYLIVAAFGILLGILALGVTNISAQASKGEVESQAVHMVTVRSGDSLWSIAERALPQMDPRDAVIALRDANDINGSALTPGQLLRVP